MGMKENILSLLDSVQSNPYFDNAEYRLTLDYKTALYGYPALKLGEDTKDRFIEEIDKVNGLLGDLIDSFNFEIRVVEKVYEHDEDGYGKGWKSLTFTFHGGPNDSGEDDENTKKKNEINRFQSCWFEFDSLGDRESIRIGQYLTRQDPEAYPERPHPIHGNRMKYSDAPEVLTKLIELDRLLDRQQQEKNNIFESLRNESPI